MKRFLLTLAAFAAVSSGACFSASAQINFVPLPQSVVYTGVPGGENFVFDKNVVIEGGCEFNVSYLKERVERAVDFEVVVSRGDVRGGVGGGGLVGDARTLRRLDSEAIRKISFSNDGTLGFEAYTLKVTPSGVSIVSGGRAGEFYAIQTLLQMMPSSVYLPVPSAAFGAMLKSFELPCVEISDYPRFAYRGNMFDVSRSFFDKEYILRHLEFLAYHKINKFHWHLTDDHGWRIEIKKYPKLTSVGAWRGRSEALDPAYNSGADAYGGYYTQDEIREIVQFAADRNIEIIPEIDLPGHSKALAVAYPEIVCQTDEELLSVQGETRNVVCAGSEGTYKILDGIFKEICKLFPSPYINIGGDEVVMENWKNCPECQAVMKKMGYSSEKQLMQYFVERMEKIASKYGKKIGGWEDIVVSDKISRENMVVVWHGKNVAQKCIDAGFPVVLQDCNNLYFDMKHSSVERGHTWAAIIPVSKVYEFDPYAGLKLDDASRSQILGVQGGLWTELLFYPPHFAEYQIFPRMCAAAEVGWTSQELRDYESFDARLSGSHFDRMSKMGIRFRLPVPSVAASRVGGSGLWKVEASTPYSNCVIRFTTDGSTPTTASPVYTSPLYVEHPSSCKFATFYGDNSSIVACDESDLEYLKPAVRVSSSFAPARGYSLDNLTLYDGSRYFRTASVPVDGDYVLFEFEEPVSCSALSVITSDPVNRFWGITEGHVEVKYVDSQEFVPCGTFDTYNVVGVPCSRPIAAVKVVCDGRCEGKQVVIRSLSIVK